jgi:hypothetical protein
VGLGNISSDGEVIHKCALCFPVGYTLQGTRRASQCMSSQVGVGARVHVGAPIKDKLKIRAGQPTAS